MSQNHSVEPKGHEGAHICVVLVNVFAFLLISATQQSQPHDENHYHLQSVDWEFSQGKFSGYDILE